VLVILKNDVEPLPTILTLFGYFSHSHLSSP